MKRCVTLLACVSLALCFATGPAPEEADEPSATEDPAPRVKLTTTLGDIVLELDRA